MDVGYYISELLGQHGDVNVPGLGYFAHTRVNGYYSDREGKFYPPGYSVQFDPQFLDDDDTLAIHIAEKKKISVASSKYFTEKFVSALKQQAVLGEAALADLGYFYTNDLHLLFRPNAIAGTDPEFFGYPPIKLHKIGKQSAVQADETEIESINAPSSKQADQQYAPIPYQIDQSEQEHLVNMARNKRRTNIWVFIILTVIAATVAILVIQRNDPKSFNFSFASKKEQPVEAPKIIVLEDDTPKTTKDTDSTTLIRSLPADSAIKTAAIVNDTTHISRWELLAGSFKDLAEAGAAIRNFKSKGIDAKIVPDMFGRRIRVSVGTFINKELSEVRRKQLLAAKKIPADSYSQFIDSKHTGTVRAKK